MSEKSTVEKVKEITESLSKDYNKNNIAKFLSSNEFEFEYNDKKYKVSKPTFDKKQQTYQAKNKKYIELLQNPDYILEEDLKKIYLKKGVDIDAIQTKINMLSKEFDKMQIKLGKAIDNKLPENEIKLFETESEKLDTEMKELSVKKTDYLEYAIESQILIFEYSYLVYLIAEKQVGKKWVKVWDTYENKIAEKDESLINSITFHACFLIRGEV